MSKNASAVIAAKRREQTARRTRKPSLKKRFKTALAFAALSLLAIAASGIIYVLFVFAQVSKQLPSTVEIVNFKPSEGTKILFSDGKVMAVLASERRTPVKLSQINKNLIDATIAIEDSRFYEHKGLDYRGIARAVLHDVQSGERREGASTISQQLARNIEELGLTKQKKLSRKIAEAVLAVKLEQNFTKDEILENYLNQIYYGSGAYGVEAGAQTYFHKHSKDLTLPEAAMLAGMPQRPSYFSTHRNAADKRCDQVLFRMVETGKITNLEAEKAKLHHPKMFKAQPNNTTVYGAPHFVNYVVAALSNEANGFGPDAVYSGLTIETTIDSRIQKAAEETLAKIKDSGQANQGALVCLDPRTGKIRAMVGGLDYKQDQFNAIMQGRRQPGSAFKPIVYTAAIDTGKCTLDSKYVDDPHLPGRTFGGWYPKNYTGKYSYHNMTVLSALKQSINTVAVKVGMETGMNVVAEYAKRMGINSHIEPVAPVALGASAVRPIELASAYSVFAAGGRRPVLTGIDKVLAPNGDILYEHAVSFEETGIKPDTIAAMNQGLQEVVLHGTGTAAASVPDAHGKTGTTSDARDAWFAGYTPDLVTIIWAAHEKRGRNGKLDKVEPYMSMPGTTGGHLCAPLWRDFMLKAIPLQQEANRAAANAVVQEQAASPAEKEAKAEEKKKAGSKPGPSPMDPMSQPPPNPSANGAAKPTPPTNGEPGTDENGNDIGPANPSIPVPPPTNNGPGAAPGNTAAPADRADSTNPARRVDRLLPSTTPRASDPGGRAAAPVVRRPDPGDELITVNICADSHKRATQWCEITEERRMKRRDVPKARCNIHKPPPGERE